MCFCKLSRHISYRTNLLRRRGPSERRQSQHQPDPTAQQLRDGEVIAAVTALATPVQRCRSRCCGHIAAGRLVEVVAGRPLWVALHWQHARSAAPMLDRLTSAVRPRRATPWKLDPP